MALFSARDQFCNYGFYHQNRFNQIIHFIFIPVITFTLIMALSTKPFIFGESIALTSSIQIPFNAATILLSVLMVYYALLDFPVSLFLNAELVTMFFYADYLYRTSTSSQWNQIILFGQVVGWGTQFLGHAVEGKRPALIDNLLQVFNAPYFVVLEAYFFFGYNPELHASIQDEFKKRNAALKK